MKQWFFLKSRRLHVFFIVIVGMLVALTTTIHFQSIRVRNELLFALSNRCIWKQVNAKPKKTRNEISQEQYPLVSFIIPSSLQRSTLDCTIQSLQHQTLTNWEAIVGVDLARSNLQADEIHSKAVRSFLQDPRVRYVPVPLPVTDKHVNISDNAAGSVRNAIIQQFAQSDWAAFVDDDDTVLPFYAEYLMQAIQEHPLVDVVVFRMRRHGGDILPHPMLLEQNTLKLGQVGISFAVRKDLFVRYHNPVVFVPSDTEDFFFLKTAYEMNATIVLSNCVSYFVRQAPDESLLGSAEKGPCSFNIVRNVTGGPSQ